MPGIVEFKDTSWTCPECGTKNEIGYVSCEGCDVEFQVIANDSLSKIKDYSTVLKVIEEYKNSITYGHLRKVESLTLWCQEKLKSEKPIP